MSSGNTDRESEWTVVDSAVFFTGGRKGLDNGGQKDSYAWSFWSVAYLGDRLQPVEKLQSWCWGGM